ncbi:TetR/AcrR family transcriptional regulator [Gordonia sp. L191]|uniref:TetR/AcrR family transcriptional regulator n=1 Tax=Gordonia sp. L191 TaxID=2982699 RepID=UPI0024C0CBD9|nr:TetR/AcrR family transcriptional regulator [Gordonia sp. L191]WHU45078.1 TetR/AcrR family transcriptional regulator [Gordonia sp. L191]
MTAQTKADKTRRDSRPARERISAAAFDILCEDGYDAASVSAIARRAGISTGAVYQHFADKQEIFDTAFDEAVVTLMSAIDPDSLAQLPEDRAQTVDLVQIIVQRGFELVDTQSRVLKFIVSQCSSNDVEIRHRILGLEAMAVDRIGDGIRRAVEHGWIVADPNSVDLVARTLLVVLVAMVTASPLSAPTPNRTTRDAFAATCDAVLRRGLIPDFGEPEIESLDKALAELTSEQRRVDLAVYHPHDRRSRLLDAALELYAVQGYRRVRPAHVAATAGLGYGTFYNYFDNRRECLQQVLDRELLIIGGLVAMVTPIPSSHAGMVADLTGLVARVAMYAEERGARLASVILDTSGIDSAALQFITGAFARLAQTLADYLFRCRNAGLLDGRVDPEAAGALVMAALIAVCLHYVQESPQVPSVKMVTDTIVRTIGCGAEHTF